MELQRPGDKSFLENPSSPQKILFWEFSSVFWDFNVCRSPLNRLLTRGTAGTRVSGTSRYRFDTNIPFSRCRAGTGRGSSGTCSAETSCHTCCTGSTAESRKRLLCLNLCWNICCYFSPWFRRVKIVNLGFLFGFFEFGCALVVANQWLRKV